MSPEAGSGTAGGAAATETSATKATSDLPFALRGWGERNLVSPRVAWARVRRREQPTAEQRMRLKHLQPDAPPIMTMTTPETTAWVHEQKAEEDPVLWLLSEATQIYVTQILQKALVCARQRQNLDGIRLWHQQCTAAVEPAKADKDESRAIACRMWPEWSDRFARVKDADRAEAALIAHWAWRQ